MIIFLFRQGLVLLWLWSLSDIPWWHPFHSDRIKWLIVSIPRLHHFRPRFIGMMGPFKSTTDSLLAWMNQHEVHCTCRTCCGSWMPSFSGREYIKNAILCVDGYRSSGSRHGRTTQSSLPIYIRCVQYSTDIIHLPFGMFRNLTVSETWMAWSRPATASFLSIISVHSMEW